MLERIFAKSTSTPVIENKPVQGSLFDIFPTEGTGEEKYATLRDINSTPHNYKLVENEKEIKDLARKLEGRQLIEFF